MKKAILNIVIAFTKMRKNAVRRKYTEDLLIKAVAVSVSYAGTLKFLGLKPAGANYGNVKRHILELQLDISHWKGQGWNKGQTFGPRRAISEYLIDNTLRIRPHINSNSLRKRLIREGLKEAKCECCGITEWNGQKAPLELDHINGNHENNKLENLQILCPNCHAQTDNYRGRNRASKKIKSEKTLKITDLKKHRNHTVLKLEEVNQRLYKITSVDLTKFGWVMKVAEILKISHAQARRFVNKYYSGEVYKRKSPA
jgi:5-methylcytosine-specific restriction endonuclease McrA